MRNKKSAMRRWFMLCLAVMLLCGCMVLCVTSSFARYRTDKIAQIPVGNAAPDVLVLQTWVLNDENKIELNNESAEWVIDGEESVLNLVIANAKNNDKSFKKQNDLIVSPRVITTIGATVGGNPIPITLRVFRETPDKKEDYFEAEGTPERIVAGSMLHHNFGEGWVYTFDLNDPNWENILVGEDYSKMFMQIVAQSDGAEHPALLRVQADAVLAED